MRKTIKLKKKVIFLGGVLLGSILASSLLFQFAVATAEDFNWQQRKGETIRIIGHKFQDYRLKYRTEEFEKATGIKVTFDDYPYVPRMQKITIALMTGAEKLDVFIYQPQTQGAKFHVMGWFEPLQKYVEDPNLMPPDFELDNFGKGYIDLGTVSGDLIGILELGGTDLMYYRADLYKEYGIAVPNTFQELDSAAEKLTMDTNGDGKIDVYGWVGRKLISFWSRFSGYGARYFDEQGKAVMNSPQAVQALEGYVKLMTKSGPPGVAGFSWKECVDLFGALKTATYIDECGVLWTINDAEKSKAADLWDATVVPAGPAGRHPFVSAWNYGINAGSANKEAAWLWIAWASRKSYLSEVQNRGHDLPWRYMPGWDDPEFAKIMPPNIVKTARKSPLLATSSYAPAIMKSTEAQEIISWAVEEAITQKGNVKEILDKANAQLQELVVPSDSFGE